MSGWTWRCGHHEGPSKEELQDWGLEHPHPWTMIPSRDPGGPGLSPCSPRTKASSPSSKSHALSSLLPQTQKPGPCLTSMTVSSVDSSCRQPSHHRSRTRGRLDLVMQDSVTFLFSDWDADPRIVMALGGTARMMGRRETLSWTSYLTDQPRRTGNWGQMTRSLALDRHDLGTQTDGSPVHGLTAGKLAPELTGNL